MRGYGPYFCLPIGARRGGSAHAVAVPEARLLDFAVNRVFQAVARDSLQPLVAWFGELRFK